MRTLLTASAMIVLLLLTACEEQEAKQVIRPVKAMQVQQRAASLSRVFPGKVKAANEVNLAFRVSGQVHTLPVKVGEFVRKGQLVARLDTTDYQTQVNGLEAQLKGAVATMNEAKLQYGRYETLVRERTASQSAYDQAKAAYETAKARVDSLKAQLDKAHSDLGYATLTAPYSGFVSSKYVDNFENVKAGQPVVKLQDFAQLEVIVGLPDDLVARKDHIVDVSVDMDAFPGKRIPATIKEIATDAAEQTRTYPVTVSFPRPDGIDVLPGMAANVTMRFNGKDTSGIILPETAVFAGDDGKSMVWKFDKATSTVTSQSVTVASVTSDGMIVSEGVTPGEWVVTAGVHYLQQGQKVRLPESKE